MDRVGYESNYLPIFLRADKSFDVFTNQDPVLESIVSRLQKDFKPLRLFLYGSRAHAIHHSESDFDFVLVVSTFDKKNRWDVMSKVSSQIRRELNVDVQVWVYSVAEFNDWKDEFGSIPETALNTGKEIPLGQLGIRRNEKSHRPKNLTAQTFLPSRIKKSAKV